MKRKNIFKIFTVTAVAVLGLSSCNDFLTIYPTDKTIGEDFWKTKEDVENMVTGAYGSMISYGCQEKAIIWGAFRSDELVKYRDKNNSNLDNISAVNLLPTNAYNTWENFYGVINRCNIVLNHIDEVLEIDPSFTQGDYDETRAQMLALRSLCYFYLVRTFRDVPYTTQSYEDDDQVMVIPQSSPDSVLQVCINDLEVSERYIMKTGAYGEGNWRNVGYFTHDAVCALLADIYLWRASINHSQEDYRRCVEYANQVIEAKDAYYTTINAGRQTTVEKDIYHLIDRDLMYTSIFLSGNSRESILEWQYDGANNANQALENYYYSDGNKDDGWQNNSILMASQIFNTVDANANTEQGQKAFSTTADYRYWYYVYEVNNAEAIEGLDIRKMVTNTSLVTVGNTTTSNPTTNSSAKSSAQSYGRSRSDFQQNWIVYRLTDVMLMKAEALVQLASDEEEDSNLQQAFDLVQVVNKRAVARNSADTLSFGSFKSKEQMERLVLAERERELCFEGKRWYDLMRYCYRHMEGVDLKTKLADQSEWPALYRPMLSLIVRKYSSGGEAVSYKMKGEPFLYWPILEREIRVNRLLRQNPVYVQDETTSKN